MIDTIVGVAGLIYAVGKDVWDYLIEQNKEEDEYKKSVRLVNANYLESSGLREAWEKKGYKLRWSKPENIPSYELKGYETLYEVNDKKKEIFSLVQKNNSILLGKKYKS